MDDQQTRMAHANQLIDEEPRTVTTTSGSIGRLEQLCCALTRALPATGTGVSLLTQDNGGGGTVAASSPPCRALEELQFSLGEGPGIDAYASGRPVLEPDLQGDGVRRWPGYARAAEQHDVRAVFAFPLQVGAVCTGALDIYRTTPGSLDADSLAQASAFAEVAMGLLVDGGAGDALNPASVDLDGVLAYRLEIYQAQGMLMVDLGVSIDDAVARLRAHAYAHGRPIGSVAKDIVAGKLTLDRDSR